MRKLTRQEQANLIGAEMIGFLERIPLEKFETYRADFLEQAEGRPTVKRAFEDMFSMIEAKRVGAGV